MLPAAASAPTKPAPPWPSLSLGQVLDFSDSLTPADRRLVRAAAGFDVAAPVGPDDDGCVPLLVVAIAIERAAGRLHGPVDPAFLQRNLPSPANDPVRRRALTYLLTEPARQHCLA